MGIVLKQSLKNTLVTYLGFGIGAVNVLFLYTNFLTDEYYGLVNVILSAATVMMPLLAFGVPNTLVKYYSSFQDGRTSDGFLTMMLLLPLALILPIAIIAYLANDAIGNFLARENTLVKEYVWYIFLIGMAMAYFEVFYAWARIRMKSVFGNFMKEVFSRVGVTLLLVLVYFDVISVLFFLKALVALYFLRTVIMKLYAYSLRWPKLVFKFPPNSSEIIVYSALIILGGSAAVVLLEIDKVMINQFIEIENVAYYSVAGFIATVIAVPSRAMHQITYPLTAELLNSKDAVGLKKLYQKSSLTLFIVSGLLFLLILLNLNDLYDMLPVAYRNGFMIVLWIGLAKLYDAVLGNNNSILYNSEYYRAVLIMGVLLAIMTILFNLWLIPKYGLNGAAIASFSAFFIYNTAKLVFVKFKFNMLPFTSETYKVIALMILVGGSFYFIHFSFHPIVNIALKSILMIAIYIGVLYRFKISEDVFGILSKFLRK
ncbi:oligosaccharide flippase family protein [Kriegella aquimaris]|uniref:Membrane protein involved in the export of O-antigen and teichoic acid n=1 Tax=Kriegella aquimaris TaxID=192904 RepID=A0A1G9NHD9_9FLAO|nr:oligosaccharide flippase family protein [Kriegella aquimaris]SDL85998.1 Membrane protein involved in the export of O-antigen and teichoic acid [Kriegella aquimaris]